MFHRLSVDSGQWAAQRGHSSYHKKLLKRQRILPTMAPQKKRKADDEEGPSKRGSVSPENVASSQTVDLQSFVNHGKLTDVGKILRVDVWSEDADKVVDALDYLYDLCYDEEKHEYSEPHCKQAGETGAGSIITAVMRKWCKSEEVVEECCWALEYCVGKNKNDSLIVKHANVSGAIEAVIWAMKTYPLNSNIQLGAIAALRAFVSLHANYIVKDMKILPLVVQSHAAINRHTSALLKALSTHKELRDAMIDAGCISIVEHIIRYFKNGEFEHATAIIGDAKKTLVNLGTS